MSDKKKKTKQEINWNTKHYINNRKATEFDKRPETDGNRKKRVASKYTTENETFGIL